MEYLLKSYHKIGLLAVILSIASCTKSPDISYQKIFSEERKAELANGLLNGAGNDLYYQGSVGERMIIHEGIKYAPDSGWGQRELGVPYLKRGFPKEAYTYYTKAAEYDGETWAGYMAYCWLYFYKDYHTVIKYADQCDAYTENFVDYPQSTSVDYMRGISYLKLGDFDEAIRYLSKHLRHEISMVGSEYVETMAYQVLGIAHMASGDHGQAEKIFIEGLKYNENAAELHYYAAINYLKIGDRRLAASSLTMAQTWLSKGGVNSRPYVEEFFAVYQEDLDVLRAKIKW